MLLRPHCVRVIALSNYIFVIVANSFCFKNDLKMYIEKCFCLVRLCKAHNKIIKEKSFPYLQIKHRL